VRSPALGDLKPHPGRLSPSGHPLSTKRANLRSLERPDERTRAGLVELFTRVVSESINGFFMPRVGDDEPTAPPCPPPMRPLNASISSNQSVPSQSTTAAKLPAGKIRTSQHIARVAQEPKGTQQRCPRISDQNSRNPNRFDRARHASIVTIPPDAVACRRLLPAALTPWSRHVWESAPS
jgi:hypothetical protein